MIKSPSEVINIALAETLASGLDSDGMEQCSTLYTAIHQACENKVTIPEVCELVRGFGGNEIEFPAPSAGIYDPKVWSPEVNYADTFEVYAGYQVNKAFFLMMMEEWFLANPAEDSWEAVAEWKMENGKDMKND